jgi:hypothetical protein
MVCCALSSFLSGCSARVPIAFFSDGKISVCTSGFATRSSDEGEGEGEGKAVDIPPSLIATIGRSSDEGEGEGEGKAVDMTVFL